MKSMSIKEVPQPKIGVFETHCIIVVSVDDNKIAAAIPVHPSTSKENFEARLIQALRDEFSCVFVVLQVITYDALNAGSTDIEVTTYMDSIGGNFKEPITLTMCHSY